MTICDTKNCPSQATCHRKAVKSTPEILGFAFTFEIDEDGYFSCLCEKRKVMKGNIGG